VALAITECAVPVWRTLCGAPLDVEREIRSGDARVLPARGAPTSMSTGPPLATPKFGVPERERSSSADPGQERRTCMGDALRPRRPAAVSVHRSHVLPHGHCRGQTPQEQRAVGPNVKGSQATGCRHVHHVVGFGKPAARFLSAADPESTDLLVEAGAGSGALTPAVDDVVRTVAAQKIDDRGLSALGERIAG
jgi:hypothetical protein